MFFLMLWKDELTKETKATLQKEAAKRPQAAKEEAEKAANLATSSTEAEAAKAALKKAAADKGTRGVIFQFYKSRELRSRFSEMEVREIAHMGGNGKK